MVRENEKRQADFAMVRYGFLVLMEEALSDGMLGSKKDVEGASRRMDRSRFLAFQFYPRRNLVRRP